MSCIRVSNTNDWDFSVISRENMDVHMYGASLSGVQAAGVIGFVAYNQAITMNGAASFSLSGVVVSASADLLIRNYDGQEYHMVDLIKTDFAASGGDSGGPGYVSYNGMQYLVGNTIAVLGESSFFGYVIKVMNHINASMYKF